MINTIELQLLNKILQDKSTRILTYNGIDESYFPNFKNEYNFIINHYKKYGTTPDKETIISNNDIKMEFFDVNESEEYLIYALKEQHLFDLQVDAMRKMSDLLNEDSFKALEYFKSTASRLFSEIKVQGKDIIKDGSRLQTVIDKKSGVQETIKTGLKELDDVVYGWNPGEELVTVVARTGQGKTWLLLWFLVAAWKQGKRVGLYSGEMTEERIGYRIDTIINNFSNRELLRGTIPEIDDYKEYLNDLAKNETPFYVLTTKHLNGRATVSELCNFAKINKLDILGVDQYTLLKDERTGKLSSTREQLEHISADLFDASIELGIPIIVLSQSNRGGAKAEQENGTPDVENIYGADAIAQNATKIITIRQTGAGFEMSIKKNRDDKIGDTLLYFWDIDCGTMKYIPNMSETEKIKSVKSQFKDLRDVF